METACPGRLSFSGFGVPMSSDRPNPEPVRQKPNRTEPNVRPNRTFGKTWVPPKRFGLWAEQVRPRSRPNLFGLSEGTQGKEGPNSYSLWSVPTIFITLSGLFWLSVRHHSREKEGGSRSFPRPPYYLGGRPV